MFNDAPDSPTEFIALATICSEAAQRHGSNWHAVERYIKKRLHALPKEQQERLANEIDRILRYRAPSWSALTQ